MKTRIRIIVLLCCITAVSLHSQDVQQMFQEEPVRWRGSISAYTEWYDPQGIEPRGGTFNWGLRGNAGFTLYGWEFPFAFSIGRQRTNFNYPMYNQFGISPSYEWLTVHLGHRNIHFSPYTLGGHTMQGVGIELRPGKLRLAAMAGTLRRAVDIRPEDINEVIPAYKRRGIAIKAGLGTDVNYVDLSFLHAKDDSSSIENPFNPELRPATNTVLGLSIRRQLSKKLSFRWESGMSVFTRDQQSEALLENDDSFWAKMFDLRYSTRINLAMKGELEYQAGKWRSRFGYDRIDPEYESMGTYFFANDVENFVFGLSGPLSTKLSLNTNAGLQRNNLLDNRNARTSRFVGSANLDYHPSPFYGVNLSYSNFNLNQKESRVPLNDSARLSNVSQTIVLAPRYSIMRGEKVHSFSAAWMHQFLTDKNTETSGSGNFTSTFINLMYALSLNANHQVTTGLNWNKVSIAQTESGFYGATLGYTYTGDEAKLTAGIQATYNIPVKTAGVESGNNIFGTANVTWNTGRLQTSLYYQLLQYSQPPVLDYTETRIGVTLTYSLK